MSNCHNINAKAIAQIKLKNGDAIEVGCRKPEVWHDILANNERTRNLLIAE